MMWILLCIAGATVRTASAKVGEYIAGDMRVQALTPRLLRVEPKGKWGFEDQNTFMVANRAFDGINIMLKPNLGGTLLQTNYYSVMLVKGGKDFIVFDRTGKKAYNSYEDSRSWKNLLHWPAPYETSVYAILDRPRFTVPEWGAAPCCPPDVKVMSHLLPTNGYDFNNQVDGDTYIFMLGNSLDEWKAARADFIALVGPTPLLPDYAYGTWFTWWHPYTESEAKGEIERWNRDKLPIDVWGLDMNWRLTKNDQDRVYDRPNAARFPDFAEWFNYIKGQRLHTYFNDHPWPVARQATTDEVNFRWAGLTKWLQMGLTFWWFDHNWLFCIPPPMTDSHKMSSSWDGLTNVAWGSHVYYTALERFNLIFRMKDKAWWGGRTIILSKYALPDIKPGMNSLAHAENPGQHRYPIWWTGDSVKLQASVESMVDCGVHDFKPFVHSDCGGFGWFTHGDLMRWTAHCAFGTIYRLHGANHQPWVYGGYWEKRMGHYLHLRYKMVPSLIAGGQRVTQTGFPYVARGDLYWPELGKDSISNHQYIFLDDVLVAPIWDSAQNMTKRSVWIPPGNWQDVWNGWIDTGPKYVDNWQPWERQPMWHRRDGGLMVLTDEKIPALRIGDQDWSSLTLDAFPANTVLTTNRTVYERSTEPSPPRTNIIMDTDGGGKFSLHISESPVTRGWLVRLNLFPNQEVHDVQVDGKQLSSDEVKHVKPRAWDDGSLFFGFFPFGEDVAGHAGSRAEFRLIGSAAARTVEAHIVNITATQAKYASSGVLDKLQKPAISRAVQGSQLFACSLFAASLIVLAAAMVRRRRRSTSFTSTVLQCTSSDEGGEDALLIQSSPRRK